MITEAIPGYEAGLAGVAALTAVAGWFSERSDTALPPSAERVQVLKRMLMVGGPFVAVAAIGGFLGWFSFEVVGSILLGLVLAGLLEVVPLSMPVRAGLSVLVSLGWVHGVVPVEVHALAVAGLLVGLLVGRLAQNVISVQESSGWSDLVPAMTWLSGVYLIPLAIPEAQQTPYAAMLAGVVGLSLILSFITSRLPAWTGVPLANGLFSGVVGLLGMLLLVNLVLHLPQYWPWAMLFGAALLLGQVIQSLDVLENESPAEVLLPRTLAVLALVGLGTVLASRLFGVTGWLILATGVSVLATARLGWAVCAFWLGRALLQGFILDYNSNITGINLLHPYVSAALYGGFLLMLLLPLAGARLGCRWAQLGLMLLVALLVPAGVGYFLHAEAAGSFLIAALTAAILVVSVAPLMGEAVAEKTVAQLLPLGVLMIAMALLTSGVLDVGATATRLERLAVFGVLMVLLVMAAVWLTRRFGHREAVDVG